MNKTSLMSAVLASALATLGACAHTPPPPPSPCTTPEPIRMNLTASPRLNPGENGESLATTVRIYQLKDTGKLVESSLDRILDGDRAVLGEDFVSVQELTLYPGEKAAPAMVRGEGAPIWRWWPCSVARWGHRGGRFASFRPRIPNIVTARSQPRPRWRRLS
jgi:type VI secretion system VasD/TssJ family lipoprotein